MNTDALNRLRKVVQTEATTPDLGNFLLTHVPFDNLYLENKKAISENELLEDILLKNPEEHKFIMVQGGNGSGKSHLIRWLKEKYLTNVDNSKEAVLLISRAHNTLQDALTQLLEADIFPEEIKQNELKHIKNAKSDITGEELNKTINFNFTLEVEADENKSIDMLDLRTRKWLSTYLKDGYIQSEFLLKANGPIERIRAKIENTSDNTVNYNEDPMFTADDFNISIQQIRQKLNVSDGRAADYTIRLAERFADIRRGSELRQKVADYLNTKVSNVIQRSMKLQTADFKKLFASLRKTLKEKNINLTLFVEDINSFTGIDEALMEVLLTDHSAEGNHDFCRIISVVGSTSAFYRDKLNASIKERIKTNIYIEESSVLGDKEKLAKFAAKYINAINLSESQIKEWVNTGANDEDMPIFKSPYKWADVDCYGKTLSIFPFNKTALWKLYNTLSPDKKTPRVFLKSIIAHILILWFTNEEQLFTTEDNFINADISIPRWENQLYNQNNINIDENSAIQRGILLKVWGDSTTRTEPGILGGLTSDVFEAFNIYCNITGNVSKETKKVSDNKSDLSNSEEIPKNIPNDIPNVTPSKIIISKPDKLIALEDDLSDWLYSKEPSKNILNNHIELRDLLINFIVSGIDWESENVPMVLVNAYINTRNRVHIEGQKTSIGEGFLLSRSEESYYLLDALINFKYMGENSWDFDGCSDYLVIATAWLERHKQEIIDTIIAPKNRIKDWNLPLWNIASIYCIKTLFDGIDISKSSEDIMIDLLKLKPEYNLETEHSVSWKELQKIVTKNDIYKNLLFNETLSYFSKSVGSSTAGSTKYIFVDALEILKQIRYLKSIQWNLDGLCPKDIDNYNSIWYYSARFINSFTSNISKVIEEENEKAINYINYFNKILDNDFSEECITLTIQSMKEFLKFLTNELNMSYVDESFKIIKNSSKLISSLSKLQKLLQISNSAERLVKISKNPFEDISKYYECFKYFEKLLEEKYKIFSGYVDVEAKNTIEKYKNEIIDNADDIISTIADIRGEANNDI